MNWKPTNEPTNSIAPRSARTSERLRRMPSRSSGAGERRSTATKAARRTALAPMVAAVSTPATSGERTTPSTSSSIPPVSVSAPATSTRRSTTARRPSRGTRRTAATSSSDAKTTGAKNTHRQPISVSSPPTTMPSEKPAAPAAP